jgi:hypothetical protein
LHPTLVRSSIDYCERLSVERLAPVIQGTTVELHESNDPTRHSVEAWE